MLHTVVPDHWAPIVVLVRQQGWSIARTARSAAIAGPSLAVQYGHYVSLASAVALCAFGIWIAFGAWKEIRAHDQERLQFEHAHLHEHDGALEHVHWHAHHPDDRHAGRRPSSRACPRACSAGRTGLLLILGSSPMLEGVPAFLAASAKGPLLLGLMALTFAIATIAAYTVMNVAGVRSLQRTSRGRFERIARCRRWRLRALYIPAVGEGVRDKASQDCARANAIYPPIAIGGGDRGIAMPDSLRKYTTWKLTERVDNILK